VREISIIVSRAALVKDDAQSRQVDRVFGTVFSRGWKTGLLKAGEAEIPESGSG